jgi:glucokinase
MKQDLYLVIDIGGTKILVVVFDDGGNIVARKKLRTPEKPLPDQLVSFIVDELGELELKTPALMVKNIVSVGICFAGFVEHQKKLVHQAPNLGWQEPVPLAALFEKKLKRPVIIENDASAAVIGEVFYGAARGHQNAIYITFSTGIGGGLFLDGQLYRGNSGFAGEIGHTKLFGKGRACNCGGENCLETWASGSGIARSAAQLWEPADLGYDELSTQVVFREAAAGNQPAELILRQAFAAVGIGLANLLNILNPSCLVIGGGIIEAHPELLKELEAIIRQNAIRPVVEVTEFRVLQAKLGADSGVWGIYALLKERERTDDGKH